MPTSTALLTLEVPDLAGIEAVGDLELLEWTRQWGEARRIVDAGLARLGGQIQARSTLEHGHQGLAQRSGARTADALLSRVTGTSGPESRSIVAVGALMDAPEPWLAEVAGGVAAGEVSVGAAAAIATGLGAPSPEVAADDLADAAHRLTLEAALLPPEKIARRARELRDALDETGIADRERMLRDRRFLKLTPLPDGMTRLTGLLDPESAALVTDAVDLVTAPRRGGPRFVDPTEKSRAEAIVADARSTGQLVLDAVVEMIRIAGSADTGRVFGSRRPAVRVHVTLADLDRRDGAAKIEGQTSAVSIQTAERHICDSGYLPIVLDDTRALDLGRASRFHSAKQRTVLAAIWGGCAVPGCDRPPSWTEIHHPEEWGHGGPTSVANGIPLCRHHHMMIHNNGWNIVRRGAASGAEYWLNPPPDDPLNPDPLRLRPQNPPGHHPRAGSRVVVDRP
jgi:hypothetical protein